MTKQQSNTPSIQTANKPAQNPHKKTHYNIPKVRGSTLHVPREQAARLQNPRVLVFVLSGDDAQRITCSCGLRETCPIDWVNCPERSANAEPDSGRIGNGGAA